MIAGLMLGAADAALLATAGPATSLTVILGGSVLLGLVALAIPAMTADGKEPRPANADSTYHSKD